MFLIIQSSSSRDIPRIDAARFVNKNKIPFKQPHCHQYILGAWHATNTQGIDQKSVKIHSSKYASSYESCLSKKHISEENNTIDVTKASRLFLIWKASNNSAQYSDLISIRIFSASIFSHRVNRHCTLSRVVYKKLEWGIRRKQAVCSQTQDSLASMNDGGLAGKAT